MIVWKLTLTAICLDLIRIHSICLYSKVNIKKNYHNSLLGNINLKKANIRPDEANRIINGIMLPVSLKAGMIANLQIKVSFPIALENNLVQHTFDLDKSSWSFHRWFISHSWSQFEFCESWWELHKRWGIRWFLWFY